MKNLTKFFIFNKIFYKINQFLNHINLLKLFILQTIFFKNLFYLFLYLIKF